MKHKITYPEVCKCDEFCKVIDGIRKTIYGKLIAVNTSNITVIFEELNNGIKKESTNQYYTNIDAIRVVYADYPKEVLETMSEIRW